MEKEFNIKYTDKEKDVFCQGLEGGIIDKHEINGDTCIYLVKVKALNSFCVIAYNFEKVYFKNFYGQSEATQLYNKIIKGYGD